MAILLAVSHPWASWTCSESLGASPRARILVEILTEMQVTQNDHQWLPEEVQSILLLAVVPAIAKALTAGVLNLFKLNFFIFHERIL